MTVDYEITVSRKKSASDFHGFTFYESSHQATLSTEQFLKIVLFRLPLSRKDGKNGRGCGKNRSRSLPQFIAGDNCK